MDQDRHTVKEWLFREDHGFDFEDIKLTMPIRHLRTDAEGMTVTGVWVQERSGLEA